MEQKELKEKYMNIICNEVWHDEHMQKYAKNSCAYVTELENGDIASIEKPSIQKDFCFGAGMYATATDEEMTIAENNVDNALTNQNYFINENLKNINRTIDMLEDESNKAYKYLNYFGQESGSKLKAVTVCSISASPEWEPAKWSNCKDLEELTTAERAAMINGYKEVKKQFIKRLETYLKKYGLTKINAWSYICD